jgi:prevent-host-death family protein
LTSLRLVGKLVYMDEVIGTYEAKSKFTELIREVEEGKSFIITKRGKRVATIAPTNEARQKRSAEAVAKLQEYMRTQPRIKVKDLKSLIEYGRD